METVVLAKKSVWVTKPIGDVLDVVTGNTPSKKDAANEGDYMPFIKPPELQNGVIGEATESLSEKGARAARVVPEDSVLISCIGNLGRVGLADRAIAFNQQINAVKPHPELLPKYLFYYFQGPNFKHALESASTATTVALVNKGNFEKLPLTYPPLPEQRRIVSAIETQLGRLDTAVARLHAAKAKLKRYKQAVLKAAVEGALTEEWREKNARVEPAAKLVARLGTMRREEWERQKRAGERRSVIQNETAEEQVQLGLDLPETWTWATPEEIASPEPYSIGIGPFGSNLKVSDYTAEGVPLIFIRHITSENFDIGLKYTSERKYKELIAHVAKPLDVLVAKMGDPPGDTTIYPADRAPGVMTADCIKLRVWDPYISREYVMHCIRSYVVKEQLGLITIGVAQKKISTGRFKTLLFPMPPTKEQFVIAEMLADRFERSKVTEDAIDAQLFKSTRLRQAVLKRAFEGRLV